MKTVKIFVLLFLLIFPMIMLANIGKITVAKGDVQILRDMGIIVAKSGINILEKDVISSKTASSAQILFNDGTVITIGANSNFKVNEYLYDEANSKASTSMSVSQGVFRAITGKIGKINPNNFKLETKSSSIGIRGTNFRGVVPPISSDTPEKIACTQGAITVSVLNSDAKPVSVPAGFMTTVGAGKVETPKPYTKQDLQEIDKPIVVKEEKKEEPKKEIKEEPKKEEQKETKEEVKKEEPKEEKKEQTAKKEEETKVEKKEQEKQETKTEVKKEETKQTDTAEQKSTVSTNNKTETNTVKTTQNESTQTTTTISSQENTPSVQTNKVAPVSESTTVITPQIETQTTVITPVVEVTSPTVVAPTVDLTDIKKATNAATETAQNVQDTIAPAVPTIQFTTTLTNDSTPTIYGKSEAGSIVTIKYNNLFAKVTTATDGKWFYTPSTNLQDDTYLFSASAVDDANNQSGFSDTLKLTIDTKAPSLSITSFSPNTVTHNTDTLPPSIPTDSSSISYTNNSTPTIGGKSETGATITIKNGDTILGTTSTNTEGIWSFTSNTLLDGTYSLSVSAKDSAGNNSSSLTTSSFTVDTIAPTITANTFSTNNITPPAIPDSSTNIVEITSDNTPTLNGKSEAGATITIKNGENTLGIVTTKDDGTWEFTPTSGLADGSYQLTISAVDKANNSSQTSITKNISIDTVIPAKLNISLSQDTGIITIDNITSNPKLTLSNIESGAILEYSTDGIKWGTSFTPIQGDNNVYIRQVDSAGNISLTTNIRYIFDNIAPILTFDLEQSNLNSLTGVIDDSYSLKVQFNGIEYTVAVNANGTWGFAPNITQQIIEGKNELSIIAEDTAGNNTMKNLILTKTTMTDEYVNKTTLTDDDYNSWGYWTTQTTNPSSNQTINLKGWWIFGEETTKTTIDNLIAANVNYTYSGNIVGDVRVNGGATQDIKLDSTNNINLNVKFGSANPITVNQVGFSTTDGTVVSQSFSTTTSPNIVNNSFSATASNNNSNLSLTNGKFYGPNANTAAGQWNGNFGNVEGSGIFKAKH